MVKIWTSFIVLLFIKTSSCAQSFPNNAVALSLGGAAATYKNSFAIENNIAALSYSENEIQVNASNRFGLSDYSMLSMAGHRSLNFATIGVAYKITPRAYLTEQKVQVGFAKMLGDNLSAGATLNYHVFSSTNAYYQSTSLVTFNAGLYYKINDKLNAGFQMFNPNRSQLSPILSETLQSTYRFGIDYTIAKNIVVYSDVLQNSGESMNLKAGIELQKEKYTLRGGFDINQLVALGFGWQAKNMKLQIAASYHSQLGFSPSFTVGYAY